jgi:hypothetical protein
MVVAGNLINQNVYAIQGKNGYVGCSSRTKNYIVGFQTRIKAHEVKSKIDLEPKIYLERRHIEEITDDINSGLSDIGFSKNELRVKDVTIDVEAKLTILKNLDGTPRKTKDLKIEQIPVSTFLMFPFDKCLGVIMPYDLWYEDENKYIFLSQVVDPCEHMLDMFRKNLHID